MKIVVAGGSGFIGSSLVEYFYNKKAEIFVIDNLRTGRYENIAHFKGLKFYNGSITDKNLVNEVLEGSDYVFNFAALVSVIESVQNPKETQHINVYGFKNILDAAVKHKVKKVVNSSSSAVYGDNPSLPLTEDLPTNPLSPYGTTKLQNEIDSKKYNKEFGLNVIALRYFNVFGPKQDPMSDYAAAIPIFIQKALKNENITIYGDGKQTRDFVFVKDVAAANAAAAESNVGFGVFNVAVGKTITILELAEKIVSFTNSKSKILFAKKREGDIIHSQASIKLAKDKIGYLPKHDFDSSLKVTIEYFKNLFADKK